MTAKIKKSPNAATLSDLHILIPNQTLKVQHYYNMGRIA